MIITILALVVAAVCLVALFFTARQNDEVRRRSDNKIEELRASHYAELENLRQLSAVEIEKLRKADASDLEDLRQTSASELERMRTSNAAEIERLRDEHQNEISQMQQQLSDVRIANAKLTERLNYYEDEKTRLAEEAEERFKNLAHDILDANSKKFKEQNESRLGELLQPLRSDLEQFRKAVNDAYDKESRERFSLDSRIRELMDLNRSIGREAKELAEALRGNSKIQGDWGEMILETILEKSGLKRDVHFHVQLTTGDDGNTLKGESGHSLRPDVVVDYPDGRCVIIDSKVSLTAYIAMVNAESEETRESYGRQHLQSVRSHIKELAAKNYQEYIGRKKTDFVMMFIPNEAAYLTAMNLAPELWQEAYDRRVLIISPTHLISVIRLTEQLWRQDSVQKNSEEIARKAGDMYDKFQGFVEDMLKIEKSLGALQSAYGDAKKKLTTGSGNLIKRAEDIRKIGAKSKKRLPQSMVNEAEAAED